MMVVVLIGIMLFPDLYLPSENSGTRPGQTGTTSNSGSPGQTGVTPKRVPTIELHHKDLAFDASANIERRLVQSVRYLASDELEGRGIGTAGIELAAEFIAEEFKNAGLNTKLYDGKPYQQFSQSRRLGLAGVNSLTLPGENNSTQTLVLRRDFTPLSISGTGELSLPVVFVGYGITAPEIGYDDYDGIDVDGKAVVVLRHEPRQSDPTSPFNGSKNSAHAYIHRKVEAAIRNGAKAVLFCSDFEHLRRRAAGSRNTESSNKEIDPKELAQFDTLLKFRVTNPSGKREVPVVHVKRHFIESLFDVSKNGKDLETVEREIDEDLSPNSFELANCRVSGNINVGYITKALKNVLGLLEGEGPQSTQTIVVGAHYDHLGYGGGWGSLAPWTRDIHNGADDNASGTVSIMEIARLLGSKIEAAAATSFVHRVHSRGERLDWQRILRQPPADSAE